MKTQTLFALAFIAFTSPSFALEENVQKNADIAIEAAQEHAETVEKHVTDAVHATSEHIEAHATAHGDKGHHGDTDHHGGKGHGNDGLPQFDPTSFPSQVFWLVVVFITMYIFFSRKTLPDISKVIDTRQEHIQNDLDGAENLKKEAEDVKEAYEAILNDARLRSSSAFQNVEDAIKKKSDKANDGFQKRSAKALADTEKSVEKAKDEILAELDGIAAKVASDAAEKITGIKVDEKYALGVVASLQGEKSKKAA